MSKVPDFSVESIAEVADCARDLEELIHMTKAIYWDEHLSAEQMDSIWMDYWESCWVEARGVDTPTIIKFLVAMLATYGPKELGAETGRRLLRVTGK